MKYLLWENSETRGSYCFNWKVTEKGFENGKMKDK